ncbi:MAG TPA: hypothetical protein VIU82_17775 [Bosea sp. (in: a-proteobacteria)]
MDAEDALVPIRKRFANHVGKRVEGCDARSRVVVEIQSRIVAFGARAI